MTLAMHPNDLEQGVIDKIRAECGFLTDADVIACAVWKFALFLEIDVPRGAFELPFRREMAELLAAERKHKTTHRRAVRPGRRLLAHRRTERPA
jgi:hypothetical protein